MKEIRRTSKHRNRSEFLESNDTGIIIPEERDPPDSHSDGNDDPRHDKECRDSIGARFESRDLHSFFLACYEIYC